jgi:septum formation protein
LGIEFKVKVQDGDENYPDSLAKEEIAVFLAKQKARYFIHNLNKNDLLITADTIVCLNDEVLGKPQNKKEAIKTLQSLSGQEHQVISGVCLSTVQKQKSFYAVTNVKFKQLTLPEIEYYVAEFKPYDKAGSYGIQEWIGYIGITHIEGSFYNVMGLPIQQLYTEILSF